MIADFLEWVKEQDLLIQLIGLVSVPALICIYIFDRKL
jgi:hypothetical protein